VFTIGREENCDLFVPDMTVSRIHARLTRGAAGWMLADLGSTNGTRVNGWRVREPVAIRDGDRVRFGAMAFVMRDVP
jgi:pSer/pThr/pTyr-binding forkhead associated (FHA) protein